MRDNPITKVPASTRRGSDKLLTLDRTLLVGIFSVGIWVATNVTIRDELVKKVEAVTVEQRNDEREQAALRVENAVLRTRLDQIGSDIDRIAKAVDELNRK